MNHTLGSLTFETSEIRTEEALIYIKASMENGSDLKTANDDMHMIDNMFAMKRSHLVSYGYMKTTWRGNARKNQTLSDAFMTIIDGRIIQDKKDKRVLNFQRRDLRFKLMCHVD